MQDILQPAAFPDFSPEWMNIYPFRNAKLLMQVLKEEVSKRMQYLRF